MNQDTVLHTYLDIYAGEKKNSNTCKQTSASKGPSSWGAHFTPQISLPKSMEGAFLGVYVYVCLYTCVDIYIHILCYYVIAGTPFSAAPARAIFSSLPQLAGARQVLLKRRIAVSSAMDSFFGALDNLPEASICLSPLKKIHLYPMIDSLYQQGK